MTILMTILITIGVILGLMLGFCLSGLLVTTKLQAKHLAVKSGAFLILGSVFSVFVMELMIFVVWPT